MIAEEHGPKTPFSQELHATKYREPGEKFDDFAVRYARATADGEDHFRHVLKIVRDQSFLPAGRQQRAVGQPFQTTASNCFVGGTIPDSTEGIMDAFKDTMLTLRTGGGWGGDFSHLRPEGDPIRGLGSGAFSTGPVSFMGIWNAGSECIWSGGGRRGAMMAMLRVDHPDILKFINAKHGLGILEMFNVSVAVTDAFMQAVIDDTSYDLQFEGKVYRKARARDVWARIMEVNWDYAEPGVIFIDRINQWNNLHYCETIAATNPCAEQPLPPHGACLLWSMNLMKYLIPTYHHTEVSLVGSKPQVEFDFERFNRDIPAVVRAVDNVIDRSSYPLPEFEAEQKAKRRMGGGVTGMANVGAILGFDYGSPGYLALQDEILTELRNMAYCASIELAKEKGSFPLFDAEKYLAGEFIKTLPERIREQIREHGIRNSHLLSIAPNGTISLVADNVSSGIEPPFAMEARRDIQMPGGKENVLVKDAAYEFYGVRGKTVAEVTPEEHIAVLCNAQKFIDSSVSKTCNVPGQISGEGPGTTYEEFKELYMQAYRGGAKGATTFNTNGKRAGILTTEEPPIPFIAKALPDDELKAVAEEGLQPGEIQFVQHAVVGSKEMKDQFSPQAGAVACEYDPGTGIKSCEE